MSDFSEWVESELKRRDWNASELAKRAGLNSGTLSNILSRTRRPGPDICQAIARAFNYSPEIVFRQAGLLPPDPEEPDLEIEEAIHLLKQLGEDDRKRILKIIQMWVEKGGSQ